MNDYRIGFVMEQALGGRVHYQNLRDQAERDPSIRATWMPVPPWRDDRWSRAPLIRRNYAMYLSLRARDMVREAGGADPFDALFFHTQSAALFSGEFARKKPILISMDATPLVMDKIAAGYDHVADSPGPAAWLKLAWYRRIFGRAAALMTFNQVSADSLATDYKVDPSKVTVIPPGIELDAWRPTPFKDLEGRPARILFVGGEFVRKGGPTLLEAFRNGLSGRCELDIVSGDAAPESDGPIRVHKGLTHADGRLKALFESADLFVLPTTADHTPHVIVEAMACGLPVVATRVGGIPEEVAEGETGLLIPPNDADALAKAVTSILDDPERRRAFGIAGRLRAEKVFDGDRNHQAMLDLAKRTIDARREGSRPDA